MRVAIVTSFFPPDRVAGAELGALFMARHFRDLGHDVHMVITRPADRRRSALEERDGIKVHWLTGPRPRGLAFLFEVREALSVLRELKPDAVNGNCLLPGGLAAYLATKKRGRGSVLCYGYDVTDMKGIVGLIGSWTLKKIPHLGVATRYCQSIVKERSGGREGNICLAGCDEKVFPHLPYRQPQEQVQLLFIGRLIPEKGFDFLLKLMTKLPAHYHLQVAGGGDLLSGYEKKTKAMGLGERVKFLGLVPNGELSGILSRSDAFILPSFREPFGVVCIEAILSGVPVVCSDVMGLPEAVEDGKNGLVVKGRESEDWLGAIKKVVEDEAFRQQIHERGGELREHWSWSTRLRDMEALILGK